MAMSATVTNSQIDMLKNEFLNGDNCVILTQGINRDNLKKVTVQMKAIVAILVH